MNKPVRPFHQRALRCTAAISIALTVTLSGITATHADDASAKGLLKAMSDYMAAQKSVSFSYDAGLEVITREDQKLALLSSGAVTLNRPDKIRATRSGGFADIETMFDGKTLTLVAKNA